MVFEVEDGKLDKFKQGKQAKDPIKTIPIKVSLLKGQIVNQGFLP